MLFTKDAQAKIPKDKKVITIRELAKLASAKLYMSKYEEYNFECERLEDGNTASFGQGSVCKKK